MEKTVRNKKSKVTEVHLEEARKLRALWDKRSNRLTQVEFGERYGIGNQSAVGQFLRGDAPLSLKAAKGFSAGLACPIDDFSPRLATEVFITASFGLQALRAHPAEEQRRPYHSIDLKSAVYWLADHVDGFNEREKASAIQLFSLLVNNPTMKDAVFTGLEALASEAKKSSVKQESPAKSTSRAA